MRDRNCICREIMNLENKSLVHPDLPHGADVNFLAQRDRSEGVGGHLVKLRVPLGLP